MQHSHGHEIRPEVSARQAWILAVEEGSPEKAADLIAHAIQMQPGNPTFRVMQGRILLAADRYADVLSTLNGIDEQQHSQAASTYKAAALLEMQSECHHSSPRELQFAIHPNYVAF